MAGLKIVTYAKISPKMVNPRDLAGNTEEEEEFALVERSRLSSSNLEQILKNHSNRD